jgi:hypothetical protein
MPQAGLAREGAPPPGWPLSGPRSTAANGTCDPDGTCASCPAECGACGPICGANGCEPGEDCVTCPHDCASCPSEADPLVKCIFEPPGNVDDHAAIDYLHQLSASYLAQ